MAEENPAAYEYEKERGYLASMDDGKDQGTDVAARTVAEIAEVEIGGQNAGSFSAYERMALGGIPEPERRNSAGKAQGTLISNNDADADGNPDATADGTQVRLVLTDHNRSRNIATSDWLDKEDIENSDPAKRPTIEFEGVDDASWAKSGRVVVLQARNQRQQFNVATANSNFNFPYIGAF